MRGFAHSRLKNYEQALLDIEGALEIEPESVRSLHQRAYILIWYLGREEEAREDLLRVLLLEPTHEGAKRLLAKLGPDVPEADQ